MKLLFTFVLALLFTADAFSQSKDETAVRQVLAVQNDAWNKGDIEKFMEGYWNSDSLMFIGSNGITYGYKNTLERYKKTYPDTNAMGKLDFTLLHVKRLSVLYFSVTGKWHLTRTNGDVGGHFTLLFKKINGKWLIVQDHSS